MTDPMIGADIRRNIVLADFPSRTELPYRYLHYQIRFSSRCKYLSTVYLRCWVTVRRTADGCRDRNWMV
jgi:hypothetical protein